jgi:hypothetical protein
MRCTASLEGGDIDKSEQELAWGGASFAGQFAIPAPRPGAARPDEYVVSIRLAGGGRAALERRYSLPLHLAQGVQLRSDRDPLEMMRDRRELGNQTETSYLKRDDPQAAASGAAGDEGGRTSALSRLAKDVKLRKSGNGRVVIDNSTMLGAGFAENPANYELLPTPELRELAVSYDRAEYEALVTKEAINDSGRARPTPAYYSRESRESRSSSGYLYEPAPSPSRPLDASSLNGRLSSLRLKLQVVAAKAIGAGLCRCESGIWGAGARMPCQKCITPNPTGL